MYHCGGVAQDAALLGAKFNVITIIKGMIVLWKCDIWVMSAEQTVLFDSRVC